MKLRSTCQLGLLLSAGLFVVAGCNLIPPSTPDATRYYVLTTTSAKPAAEAADSPH